MTTKTLFLAWQDKDDEGRQWFPVGRLDVTPSLYRFRYIGGAKRAEEEAGFPGLIEFPHLDQDYRSSELFALFQNRIMSRARPDFAEYLRSLDLPQEADPIEILSANGGYRATDASRADFFCTVSDTSIQRRNSGSTASSRRNSCTSRWS